MYNVMYVAGNTAVPCWQFWVVLRTLSLLLNNIIIFGINKLNKISVENIENAENTEDLETLKC